MRLIDAQALEKQILELNPDNIARENICTLIWLNSAQTADATPNIHAKFEKEMSGDFHCTNCNKQEKKYRLSKFKKFKYCPYCGAKMDLE